MAFVALYAIIKGFLDERTRVKIRIIGSNFQPVLQEAISPENLPDFLGGTCTCPHVEGGCLHSDAGPWNDKAFAKKNKELLNEVEEEKKQDTNFPQTASEYRSGY